MKGRSRRVRCVDCFFCAIYCPRFHGVPGLFVFVCDWGRRFGHIREAFRPVECDKYLDDKTFAPILYRGDGP